MSQNKRALIVLPLNHDGFDYEIPLGMSIQKGDLVVVECRGKPLVGCVWHIFTSEERSNFKILPIQRLLPGLRFLPVELRFYEWVARYTLCTLGMVIKMALGGLKNLSKWVGETGVDEASIFAYKAISFRPEQETIATRLKSLVENKKYKPLLLDGVTGSGKTEVYFEGIAACLAQGQQALVLLPEIVLSTAWLQRFNERFEGLSPTLWHSHLTPKQRAINWLKIIRGEARVIVGARSALMLPYKSVGFIVVDEEHEASFKQESGVFYQARDMAIVRAHLTGCPILLSSATPSLESISNIEHKGYEHHVLTARHGKAQYPTVEVLDMRKEKLPSSRYISDPLWRKLEETVAQKEQALLFLNRRGYAPLYLCRECGEAVACAGCHIAHVYHTRPPRLMCHHCGNVCPLPSRCQECGSEKGFIAHGPGVERVEEEVKRKYPHWRTIVMTSDTVGSLQKGQEALEKIQKGEVDVIIGTQTMAKGHHFPNLTLVGVVDAQMGHAVTDLRNNERTYQLLHQVGGRAGRGEKKGHVVLQTYTPDARGLQALQQGDRDTFLAWENKERDLMQLPPYGRLSALIISAKDVKKGKVFIQEMVRSFPQEKGKGVQLLGPAPAPLHKLKHWYRWRLLLKSPKSISHHPLIRAWLYKLKVPAGLKLQVDIDPFSFY